MSFLLIRVDDRMIHGQVVVGWANYLHPDRIVLCNDEIASNQFDKDLYESSFSDSDVSINVFSTDELLNYVKNENFNKEKCILLLKNPKDALKLYELNVPMNTLTIGGLHYQSQKKELNDYIFLDNNDIHCLDKLANRGIVIEGQDTPNAKKIDVMKLIHQKLH